MTGHPTRPANPWPGMIVLSAAIFVCTVSEFLPTGLLPEIAAEFEVPAAQVGLLVTAFAAAVVAGSAPLTALTRRWPRRRVIVTALLVFVVANLVAAAAPAFWVLALARIAAGAAHGVFWAVAAAYPVHLVEPARLARAIVVTNIGGTVAFVLGVPLGTVLGQLLGWRLAFAALALLIAVLALTVLRVLPRVPYREPALATGEIALPARRDPTIRAVLLICAVTLTIMLGQHTLYTFIAPWLAAVAGIDGVRLPIVLFVYGCAGALGLVAAGVLGRDHARRALVGGIALAAVAVLLLALTGVAGWTVYPLVAVWGAVLGLLPALIQVLLLRAASPRIRDVASAFLTTAFNIGIGGGALLGAGVLSVAGVEVLPYTTAALLLLGSMIPVLAGRLRVAR